MGRIGHTKWVQPSLRGWQIPFPSGGFTLIEILVSVTILAIIVAAVYASFASVSDASAAARLSAEEMRMREFLTRSFSTNLGSVYTDPALLAEECVFRITNEKGSQGEKDTLEFCSSAPMLGKVSPPGSLKRVTYSVGDADQSDLFSREEQPENQENFENAEKLTASEQIVNGISVQSSGDLFGDSASDESISDFLDSESESSNWSVPASAFDVAAYDGAEWMEEWDSVAMGRLPWCVRIRVNYARTDDEKRADSEAGINAGKDVDFETVIPLHPGEGIISPNVTWLQDLSLPLGYNLLASFWASSQMYGDSSGIP